MTDRDTQIVPLASPTSPRALVRQAQEMARTLADIVERQGLALNIRGRRYLRIEAWQTLASFAGIGVGAVEVQEVVHHDEVVGYRAHAQAWRHGEIISEAWGECTTLEEAWRDRPRPSILAMAQTRAVARCLRQALGWVVALTGYEAIPVEEAETEPAHEVAHPAPSQSSPPPPTGEQVKCARHDAVMERVETLAGPKWRHRHGAGWCYGGGNA